MYRLWAPKGVDGDNNSSPLSRVIGSYAAGREKEVSWDRSKSRLALKYGKGKERRERCSRDLTTDRC